MEPPLLAADEMMMKSVRRKTLSRPVLRRTMNSWAPERAVLIRTCSNKVQGR
jgi:hypothetical protein